MIDRELFQAKLSGVAEKNGLSHLISGEVCKKLYSLTLRMLEVNERMNLTAICDLDGILLKHYIDSLTVSKYIPENQRIIDVGCGAGFPSLPLAIARPDLEITALDSTAKRVDYIRETAELLGLSNILCVTARAEELAHDVDFRASFDASVARAVARLNVLAELCIPYVKVGGKFIAMKANAEDEAKEAYTAIKTMGGGLAELNKFELVSDNPGEENPRCIVLVEKTAETPKIYPRNNSQIKKKPL